MSELSLTAKVLAVCGAFEKAGISYAVGGALALAYYAEPRATQDIDLNLFIAESDAERGFRALHPLGITPTAEQRRQIASEGQARLDFAGTYLDLFFAAFPFHESCRRRVRELPFDGGRVRVLSAEDLVVFKVLFNRPKDWQDVAAIVTTAASFDHDYVLSWLDEMVGPDDAARGRFARLSAESQA